MITSLLRAARQTGFESVEIELKPDGNIRASFSMSRLFEPVVSDLRASLPEDQGQRDLTDGEQSVADIWAKLGVRERKGLVGLYELGGAAEYKAIHGVGNNTQETLEAKGYVQVADDLSWSLTREGERICRIVRLLPPKSY